MRQSFPLFWAEVALVNNLPPSPFFSDLRILKDFKCFVFGSADCKGVTRLFFGSADSKGVTTFRTFGRGKSQDQDQARDVRIDNCDNTKESNMLVMKCQGPFFFIWRLRLDVRWKETSKTPPLKNEVGHRLHCKNTGMRVNLTPEGGMSTSK